MAILRTGGSGFIGLCGELHDLCMMINLRIRKKEAEPIKLRSPYVKPRVRS